MTAKASATHLVLGAYLEKNHSKKLSNLFCMHTPGVSVGIKVELKKSLFRTNNKLYTHQSALGPHRGLWPVLLM
jgi:hypothetical protein